MLTVFHAKYTRSLRVLWLCEEMGIRYEKKPGSPANPSAEFLAVSPLGTSPAIIDGNIRMTESIAILLYLMRNYGPTDLNVQPNDSRYADFMEYLLFGEASLGGSLNPVMFARFYAPEAEKMNWSVRSGVGRYIRRIEHLVPILASRRYITGDHFTAADISLGYAIGLTGLVDANDKVPTSVASYAARLFERPAYHRAVAQN